MCEKHYQASRREARGRERRKPEPWTDARRDAYHRRRAQKRATFTGDPVIRTEIAARDGFVCGICSGLVDMSLVWPEPWSPSLDHIFPLSRGGVHAPANVQLAHLRCNVAKGARMEVSP